MRMWLVAVIALGALAIGGVPALAFTMAANDHPVASRSTPVQATHRHGPPPWAGSNHHGDKRDKGEPGHGRAGKHMSMGLRHGTATRGWAHCVADKAADSPGDGFNPRRTCGTRPVPPGQQKKRR